MEEKVKKVLLLSLQMRWDMGYCFQIEGMSPRETRKKQNDSRNSKAKNPVD
jgi:hypothetical protein